jgi:hypothetical protein
MPLEPLLKPQNLGRLSPQTRQNGLSTGPMTRFAPIRQVDRSARLTIWRIKQLLLQRLRKGPAAGFDRRTISVFNDGDLEVSIAPTRSWPVEAARRKP